jgi:putative ABC transport system permease protein
MFFLTYLGRELRRRMRQSVVIALGLALGVGLVITVTAASAGVKKAQADVLSSLYGVGTDATVTKTPSKPSGGQQQIRLGAPQGGSTSISGSGGNGQGQVTECNNGKCHTVTGGTISSGRNLKASDADSDVAVVDSDYAIANNIKTGSKITVGGKSFTVVGLVKQSQGSGAPDVYIPLTRAQALVTVGPASGAHLKNDVNTIYVAAASATDIAAVQKEIQHLLPGDTVTTAASQVTGSVASTAKLADDLGRWLSILVLIAAFALACLMTLAAVSRRVREFGTLKALGWRSRRLIGQVMGEAIATGVIGGAAGVGLGYLGATVINKTAHKLTASVSEATGQHFFNSVAGGTSSSGPVSASPDMTHTVYVPLIAQVGLGVVVAAVLLAILGGLLAGAAGGWRIGRLRPAVALATVE